LRITPDRILAPVGSEVVLKAGICSAQGYLIANQRVEWLLSPSGTGEFVDLGERDQVTLFRPIWDTPTKFDNNYAITSTSFMPVCLNRGTPEPTDDVQILKGDAWITVTSAKEGASHVTAYAPAVSDWNLRRAIATIYWVDAQWVLPPSAVVESGRPHVLTTTVMRRTDGAPLAGWLVRYDVGSGASLGYEGGGVVEVPTDAAGRASAEVSPANIGGGSSTVGITIIRPPQAGGDPSPRLEIGRGAATITWAGGVTSSPPSTSPYTPAPPTSSPFSPAPPTVAPGSSTDSTPQPTLPTTPAPTNGYSPPPDAPPPGQARLDVQLRREGPEQVSVGERVRFELTVTNVGNGTARVIQVRDRFDRGLRHPAANEGIYEVTYPHMRALAPNESETLALTFDVVAGGNQCHEVTVTAEGADPVRASGCVTGAQAALTVTATGPRTQIVDEIAEFRATIKNDGDVEARNIELVARCDPALDPAEVEVGGHERLQDGGILFRIESLAPGASRAFNMTARCRTASNRACTVFTITADGGVLQRDEACVEILPPRPPAGATGAAGPGVRIVTSSSANPARSGQRVLIYVDVQNPGDQPLGPVQLRVILPPELTPDLTQIQPPGQVTVQGRMLVFTPLASLPVQDTRRYIIPVTAGTPGEVTIYASAGATSATGESALVPAQPIVIRILPQ
jgi:uncharacterized repeat protein (TIGR01451 family)